LPGAGTAIAAVIPLSHPLRGDARQAALDLVRAHGERLGNPQARIRFDRQLEVPRGQVLRYVQVHQGLDVLGGEVAVLIQDSRVVALSGQLQDLGSAGTISGKVDRARAQQAVQAALPGVRVRRAHLALLAGEQARVFTGRVAARVWVVDAISYAPLGIWEVLVDGRSNEVLYGLSTMQDVKGRVYTTNKVVGQLVEKTLENQAKKDVLQGTYANVQRCKIINNSKLDCDRLAKPDSKGDFLYNPDEPKLDDPFAEVQAYYHVDAFHQYMEKNFKFKRSGVNQIDVHVNLQYDYNGKTYAYPNAFFGDLNGDSRGDLSFGQGKSRDFAHDADVIYHEFTHSVVDATSDLSLVIDELGFNVAPAALNEGFADLFSCIFAGDPVVGDYMTPGGIRNINGAASCPAFLAAESHNDGLIWGRAVWAIRSSLTSTDAFDKALYTTMATLTKYAGFAEAAKLLAQTVKSTDPALAQAIEAEMKARGVDTCSRIVPLTEKVPRKGYIYGRRSVPSLQAIPGGLQYKIEVPQKAVELTITISGSYYGPVAGYIRKDKTVTFAATGSAYDLLKDTTKNSITISTKDTNPLVPGATYYVLPMYSGNDTNVYQISYTIKGEVPPLPDASAPTPDAALPAPDFAPPPLFQDAGVNPQNPDNILAARRGCDCATGASPAESWPALLSLSLLVGLMLRRRMAR